MLICPRTKLSLSFQMKFLIELLNLNVQVTLENLNSSDLNFRMNYSGLKDTFCAKVTTIVLKPILYLKHIVTGLLAKKP